jgi:hypothetical protein
MPESRKIEAYRRLLHDLAKSPASRKPLEHQSAPDQEREAKAAKLGLEIQGEESKAAPKPATAKRATRKH